MINAAICNQDMTPITDDTDIAEDSEFGSLETMAKEFAESGTRCCIKWHRDTDGQVAYWGPKGACFEPHWYAQPGRPPELKGGGRRNVYMDDASWAKALELGDGNASEGIRKALERAS